jgi:hypothetical protein
MQVYPHIKLLKVIIRIIDSDENLISDIEKAGILLAAAARFLTKNACTKKEASDLVRLAMDTYYARTPVEYWE